MQYNLLPMALYAVIALAVAVTARLTVDDVRDRELSGQRPWLLWSLLHIPVLVALLHLCGYLFWQLLARGTERSGFEQVNLMIHTLAVVLVGAAGMWIYREQLLRCRSEEEEEEEEE